MIFVDVQTMVVGVGVLFMAGTMIFANWKNSRLNDSVSAVATSLNEAQKTAKTTSKQPKADYDELVRRIEEVERRTEEIHADALRYLQKASTQLQRAKRNNGNGETDEMTEDEARALIQQAEETPVIQEQLTLDQLEGYGVEGG